MFGLLYLGLAVIPPLGLVALGVAVYVVWIAAVLWFIYRVVRGWVSLYDGRPMTI